jgi:hypothetical protein
MTMVRHRLVHLIEAHSQELADCLPTRVQESDAKAAYINVPAEELRERVYEVYRHLGDWLVTKDELGLERRYSEIGARRAGQGVPLSQLVWTIVLTKESLWEFIKKVSILERPAEIPGRSAGRIIAGNRGVGARVDPTQRRRCWCGALRHSRSFSRHVVSSGAELEMLELLDQFFGRAICYAAGGYERVAKHFIMRRRPVSKTR